MESLSKILFVAFGGALGAVARYLVNLSPLSGVFEHFPLPTFFINVTGSFLIGFFLILFADKVQVSEGVRMMIVVGFLGAFTTFSTFEIEIYGLLRDRMWMNALVYLFASVIAGFIGVAAGIQLARRFSGLAG